MWIKDEFGDLINLDGASAVYVYYRAPRDEFDDETEVGYEIYVAFGRSRFRLTRPLNEARAEALMRRIQTMIVSQDKPVLSLFDVSHPPT